MKTKSMLMRLLIDWLTQLTAGLHDCKTARLKKEHRIMKFGEINLRSS